METAPFRHRVIAGRIMRSIPLEAADTRRANRHVSAKRPVSYATQQETRRLAEIRAL